MKFLLDERGAFQWIQTAGINLKVIFFAAVNPAVLPAGEADHPVAPLLLAGLQNFQRREHANEESIEARQERGIFRVFVVQHDVINDQIVALSRLGGDGMAHAAQGPGADRPGPDHNQRLSVFGGFLKGETIGMILQRFRQHGAEVIHLNVQEGLARNFLQLFCNGALARVPTPLRRMI